MIYILNFAVMLLSIIVLCAMLWRTRRIDDVAWWTLRVLLTYALIANTIMTYDAYTLGIELSMDLVLLRLGFVALVFALLLLWHLLRRERKNSHIATQRASAAEDLLNTLQQS